MHSLILPILNDPITLTNGWNRIEFSWDGSVFSFWNTPLGGSRVRQFYDTFSGTNYENQKFVDDNPVSLDPQLEEFNTLITLKYMIQHQCTMQVLQQQGF